MLWQMAVIYLVFSQQTSTLLCMEIAHNNLASHIFTKHYIKYYYELIYYYSIYEDLSGDAFMMHIFWFLCIQL